MATKKQVTTVDEYIEACPEDVRGILEKLRQVVRRVAPDAVESISYQVPTFKVGGTYLTYFAAWKDHIGMYPIPSGTEAFRKKLTRYRRAKGSVHFPLAEPIPYGFVQELLTFQLKDAKERQKRKKPRPGRSVARPSPAR